MIYQLYFNNTNKPTKSMAPKFLRKIFLGNSRFVSQKGRKRIYNCKFPKVRVLSKGRSRD